MNTQLSTHKDSMKRDAVDTLIYLIQNIEPNCTRSGEQGLLHLTNVTRYRVHDMGKQFTTETFQDLISLIG